MVNFKKPMPLWVANSFVFLILFLAVIAYFFWQNHLLKQAFLNHARQHAAVVSEVIRLNAKGTLESLKSIEDILQNLLENTARFVSSLDQIEPFDQQELTAFARESGLAGISIIRDNQTIVHGPDNWKKNMTSPDCPANPVIHHLPEENLYLLIWPGIGSSGCLVLGINDEKIAGLKNRLALENIIKTMSKAPGISYIRINAMGKNAADPSLAAVAIIRYQGEDVAEARQLIEGMELTVGVNAGHLAGFIIQLRVHLFLFSFCLAFAGICLSIVLHRYQTAILNNVKRFERELSLQREDATLGRSAAAIAHEIRNPLNSLSIGLQRLEMEKACGAEEHQKLIRQMRDAVHRANGSVTGLLNYARPRIPKIEKVSVASLAMDLFNLYRKTCENLGIKMTTAFDFKGVVDCDGALLGQVMENIIKNAMEAQPGGGFIHCGITQENKEVSVMFRNTGCVIAPDESGRILEPYFTTRAEGTGLGMAIANTIIKALGGHILINIRENGVIETYIHLPPSGNP